MKNKQHILVVGSPSIHTINFIELMKKNDVLLSFLGEEILSYDVFLHEEMVDVRSKKGVLFGTKRVLKAIKKINPDSIHIQQINRLAYFTAKAAVKLNIPYAVTAWGSDVLLIPNKSKFHYKLTQFVLNNASNITGDSNEVIEAMKRIVPEGSYFNINFGVEFLPSNFEKENIIYSNRLHEELYQIDKIIVAFSKAIVKYPDWKLVIGANGSLTEELKDLVVQKELENNVEFIGWVSKEINWEFYHKSKIYCSIPKSDGTAISLLEAMYAKSFPVVWDLPVAKEWLKSDKNGIVVQDDDFISKAIESLPLALLEENKNRVVETSDKNIVAVKFLNLHNQ